MPVYVTRAEAHRMIAAAPNARDAFLLEFLWHTAARESEALAARVADVTPTGIRLRNLKQGAWTENESGQRIYVRDDAAEKHVFLHPAFLDRLRARVAGLPLAAPIVRRLADDGAPITRQRIQQVVRAAAVAADVYKRRRPDGPLRPASPHLFRHGAAVHMLLSGVSITAVGRQLGHASLESTAWYTQLADGEIQRQIAAVEY